MVEPNTRYDLPPEPPRRSFGDVALRVVWLVVSFAFLGATWSGQGWTNVAGPICLAAGVVLGTVLIVKRRRSDQRQFKSEVRHR